MKIKRYFLLIFILIFLVVPLASCSQSKTEEATNTKSEKPKGDKPPPVSLPAELLKNDTDFLLPTILGQPTDSSITVNIVPKEKMSLYIEYGDSKEDYNNKTETFTLNPSVPNEIYITKLNKNTRYYYKLNYKLEGQTDFLKTEENSFMTQRSEGSEFTFGIQGDSHPERGSQFSGDLYLNTMKNVVQDTPDFYMTIGDDFSVDTMKNITKPLVEGLYTNQRKYLGVVAKSSPLFLVNGNHEQAAKYVLDGTENNSAVWAQNSRNSYFSQPLPNSFYGGDNTEVPYIGKLRDYYSFSWGDALFVVIDPYWNSSVPVDNSLNGGEKRANMWDITLGDEQYAWLKKTLEESTSKYKFVFTHHVLGTGRGGIEMAKEYEWGGNTKNGSNQFKEERPNWQYPIHELMVKTGVTIFFQGHDHIFVKQELDGVIYQTLPEPADPNYALYNDSAYKTGEKYGNTGHVRVTVSGTEVKVDYISSAIGDGKSNGKSNGEVIYSYTVN